MICWSPEPEDLQHLNQVCPNIKSLKLLMNDKEIYEMAKIMEEMDWEIAQLEIHHVNSDFVSLGINRLCVTFAHCLVSLKLTILDRLTWHSIQIIADYCQELKLFHLDIWDKIIFDNNENLQKNGIFAKLEDLKIKCEDYTDPLPEIVTEFFLKNEFGALKNLQITAHLSWLNDEKFTNLWSLSNLQR